MGIRERLRVSKKLNPFLKGVWLPSFRRSCKGELIDHIVNLMKDNPYFSEDVAIRELGDAKEVAASFKRVQRRLLGKSLVKVTTASILGFALVPVLIVAGFLTTLDIHDLGANKYSDKYLRLIIEEQNEFAKYEVFQRGEEKSDAGKLLNSILEFEYNGEKSPAVGHPSITSVKKYLSFYSIPDRGKEGREARKMMGLFSRFALPAALNVDTSLLRELLKYDHWDLYKNNDFPHRMVGAHGYRKIRDSWILPDTRVFLWLVRCRLTQALTNGDYFEGLSEVRNVAKLLYSTETLIGLYIATHILRAENQFIEALDAKSREAVMKKWIPVPSKLIDNIKRLSDTQIGLLSFGTKLDTLDLIFPKGREIPLLCVSLNEALFNHVYDRSVHQSLILTKAKHREYADDFDNYLSILASRCRLTLSKRDLERRETIILADDESFNEIIDQIEGPFPRFLARIIASSEFGSSVIFTGMNYLMGPTYARQNAAKKYGEDFTK